MHSMFRNQPNILLHSGSDCGNEEPESNLYTKKEKALALKGVLGLMKIMLEYDKTQQIKSCSGRLYRQVGSLRKSISRSFPNTHSTP